MTIDITTILEDRLMNEIENGKPRRLSDELDRLDRILDILGDGLNEAVADAVRGGVQAAVREAVREVLTDLGMRVLLAQLATDPRTAVRYQHGHD